MFLAAAALAFALALAFFPFLPAPLLDPPELVAFDLLPESLELARESLPLDLPLLLGEFFEIGGRAQGVQLSSQAAELPVLVAELCLDFVVCIFPLQSPHQTQSCHSWLGCSWAQAPCLSPAPWLHGLAAASATGVRETTDRSGTFHALFATRWPISCAKLRRSCDATRFEYACSLAALCRT